MKQFTLGVLGVAVATAMIPTTQADTYDYQQLETPETVEHLFPTALNNNRHAVVLGQFPTDLEIDLTRLQPSTLASLGIDPNDEDLDLENYELSYVQYNRLVGILRDGSSPLLENPRISYNFAGFFNGQDVTFNEFFNDTDPQTPETADSTDHYFYGLNNNDVRVGWGTAPYRYEDFTYTGGTEEQPEEITISYAQRDFTRQALWSNGITSKTYAAPEQSFLGGETVMMDISDTNYAAGFVSVALSPQSVETAENCQTAVDEGTTNRSVYVCMWQRWYSLQNSIAQNLQDFYTNNQIRTNQSIYDMAATVWQLDANGEVISSQHYGTLMDRGEEDENDFSSYAYAVNNQGVAVGQSWTYYEGIEEVGRRIKMPAIFIDGEVKAITEDPEYVWGSANDINDDNEVVGFLIKRIQGIQRYVGFIYDIDTDTLTELPGFFIGSSTFPNEINNDGLIVGSGEIEASLSTQRRRVGFIYDSRDADARFVNLNDTVDCDANLFIASADAINDNGEIAATIVKEESRTGDEGETFDLQIAKTIIMDPTGGELNACSVEDNKIERQGAATGLLGFISMLLIGGLITVRRWFRV